MQDYLFETKCKSAGEIFVSMDEMVKEATKSWLNDTAIMIRANMNKTTIPKLSFYRTDNKTHLMLSFVNRVIMMEDMASINIAFEVGDDLVPGFNEFSFDDDEAYTTVTCRDSIDALQIIRLLIKYVELPGVSLNLEDYLDQHEKIIESNQVEFEDISTHDICCPNCKKVIVKINYGTDLRDVFALVHWGRTLDLETHIPIEHQLDCIYYAYWYQEKCKSCGKGYFAFQVTLSRFFDSDPQGFKTYFLNEIDDYHRFNYSAACNRHCTSKVLKDSKWIGTHFTTKYGTFWEHTFGPYPLLENDEANENYALSVITQLWQELLTYEQ